MSAAAYLAVFAFCFAAAMCGLVGLPPAPSLLVCVLTGALVGAMALIASASVDTRKSE